MSIFFIYTKLKSFFPFLSLILIQKIINNCVMWLTNIVVDIEAP